MPTCKKCNREKDASSFYVAKNTKSGLNGSCKDCMKQSASDYAKLHRTEANANHRKWVSNNYDKERLRISAYAKAHPEKARERKRRFRLANPKAYRRHSYKGSERLLVSVLYKSIVLKRDGGCLLCGSRADLRLHHIIPVKGHGVESHALSNLATLCADCHLYKAHSGHFHKLDLKISLLLLLKVRINQSILFL
jgi:5-methylcytosine-specific restriction endonuclease McrA